MEITRIRELFTYCADGTLVRRIAVANQPAGKIAGTRPGKCPYWRVRVDGEWRYVHQVIFFMHHGFLPTQVDHINRVKTDNRIENLRPSLPTTNALNRGATRVSRTGVKGCFQTKAGRFKAQRVRFKKLYYVGTYNSPEEAESALRENGL